MVFPAVTAGERLARYPVLMSKPQDPTKHLRIAAPCPAAWEGMAGDERVRHCASCDLNVYNFAHMTRGEISELLTKTEGRVCGRLYRRADGTVLTSDCPSRLQALRQRMSRLGTTVFAALVGLSSFASESSTPAVKQGSRVRLDVESAATPQQASFGGVVRNDETGTPIPGVTVLVKDEATQLVVTATTDANGAFAITSMTAGIYRIEVTLEGFETALVEHVLLKENEATRAQVTLRIDSNFTLGVITLVDPTPKDPMTTTFSQEFMSKVPIGN